MTRHEGTSSLAATYLGPVTETFTYPGTGFTFQPPGDETPSVTWQAAADAADLVAVAADGMSRTVELAIVTRPVFGPIQPDGSADASLDRGLAYVVLTMGVPMRGHGKMRPRGSGPRPTRLGTALEVVSALTGRNLAGFSGPGLTRAPADG
jgi:hypothetical protein